jgi:hypothetical protein
MFHSSHGTAFDQPFNAVVSALPIKQGIFPTGRIHVFSGFSQRTVVISLNNINK